VATKVLARVPRWPIKSKWSAFVAYLMGMASLIALIAILGAVVAQHLIASSDLLWGKCCNTSRVKAGLDIQSRAASWTPVDRAVMISPDIEPGLTLRVLAAGMDNAESADQELGSEKTTVMPDVGLSIDASVQVDVLDPVQASNPARSPPVSQRQAVAGWKRRSIVRRVEVEDESPARLIERSLRAEI
jgi:hypothetical protein